jgi:hypothetical protein
MSAIVYRIVVLLEKLLLSVPVGTNLGLLHLLLAILSGRLLQSRGAVFPALSDLGLSAQAVRRAGAALSYGRFDIADLLADWRGLVLTEGVLEAHTYEDIRPVACDLVGFFRPRLTGCVGQHYQSQADKALPAVVLALVAPVGSVGKQRLALPRLLRRQEPTETTEADFQRRVLLQAGQTLAPEEALIVDAGFALADLLAGGVARFVVRLKKNSTARRNRLPAYKSKGRPPVYGARVRPLRRKRQGQLIAATPPDRVARWKAGSRLITAHLFDNLVLSEAKPGSPSFRIVVIFDPRYAQPLVLATNLSVSAYALWRLYRDRWPIEQIPLAAKQMLGAERAFVFAEESRHRLPELALLAGNILSYVAATSAPVATGFWDRASRPTCGRLRRALSQVNYSVLPFPAGQLRKKESVTAHLPKGVKAHRRKKVEPVLQRWRQAA